MSDLELLNALHSAEKVAEYIRQQLTERGL